MLAGHYSLLGAVLNGLEYANVMLYTEFVETMNMNVLSEEKEIPLFKKSITIPVAHGVASVNIECNLVISAELGISLCPELALEVLKVWKPLTAGVEVSVKGAFLLSNK